MQEYADIHSHILPGIDDGAKDTDMSLKMLKIAEDSGIRKIILTPHNKPMHRRFNKDKLKPLVGQLQEELNRRGMEIRLYAGSELYYRSELIELLERNEVCTMADSFYVLVEFNPMEEFDYIRNGIYQLMAGGYYPILAHAERYSRVCSNPAYAEELAGMGCYIQINAGSIMGECGSRTKHFTRRMLKHRLVHFVATDAHDDKKRRPCLDECAKYISRKYGEEYAETLFKDNPMKIIADEYI